MKKYLITGALALVACATLTSCHSDDELSGSIIEQKMKAYEQVFEEEFGKVDPNQDWGFGTAEILARTRAAMAQTRADGQWANYHGEQADGHLWTSYGFHAPDALSAGQKLRVQFYFQTVKNPGGNPNYGVIDFFMQQVYDGCTDPITDYSNLGYTSPTYSLEKYPAASSTETHTDYIESGEHMDHLTASDDNTIEHINNFNNGNFPDPIPNVANWDQTVQDDHSQEHEDQIMLMLNTPTKYFGYANSDASYVRTDRWRLVSGDVIDNYCDNVNNAEWLKFLAAHTGVVDDPCYDEWKRSYIGFDFDMIPDDNVFAGQKVDANNNPVYNGPYDHMNYTYFSINLRGDENKVWNGTELVDASTVGEIGYLNGNKVIYPYKPGTTEKIHLISANTNQFCGDTDNTTWTDNDWVYSVNNGPTYTKILPSKLTTALTNGWLPKNDKEWVKVGGCNDGYYSDWIVSFMPASPVNEPEPSTITIPIEPGSQGSDYRKDVYYKKVSFDEAGSGRVFCEDLGVVRASDIDFNDIVFDVLIYKTELITKHMVSTNGVDWDLESEETTSTTYDGDIWLLAGGGTIPATIQAGGNNYNVKNSFEYQLSDKIIVNTIENDEGRYGNQYRNYTEAKKLNTQPLAIASVADAHIYVEYGSQFYELVAYKGVAPHKICVPLNTKWLKEREEISNGYPNFTRYVKYQDADGNSLTEGPGVTTDEKGNQIGDGKEYSHDERANSVWETYNESSLFRGDPVRDPAVSYTARHELQGWSEEEVYQGESDVTGGGTNSGYRNGDPVLVRRRH
ncbi:MAG: hypothetical protein IK075_07085 [Prevotella sp.]|nr:hypothetical protein [Prevotella sp.]